ncbi:HAMP domain-containing histidine kinase, partial [Bacteroidales bacterium MSK.15.36]|nr:HAMP domain-containing histidine kinase [Bacteroidales bacterium MSK.15.36]
SENLEVYIKTLKEEKEKQYRFFNNATHQLKTPLTSIIGYSDLIQRISNNKEGNMIEECGTYINTEGKRLLVLIEDILDVSKYEKNSVSIERKICNIKEIVEKSLKMIKVRLDIYNIKLHVDVPDKELCIDFEKTCDVILNIIDNAIKHSECNNIYINSVKKEDNFILIIKDDGNGIDREQIDKVFEPFFRVRGNTNPGNGLGLSICKNIMEIQDGNIAIDNKEGLEVRLIFKMLQVCYN